MQTECCFRLHISYIRYTELIYRNQTFGKVQKSQRSNAEITRSQVEASLLTFSLSVVAAPRGSAGNRGKGTFVALSVSQAAGAPV